MTTTEILKEAEGNMKKTVEVVKKEFASMRAGRATPALLDKIMVNYYGTPTPVNQIFPFPRPDYWLSSPGTKPPCPKSRRLS
jgi:ribosome recycling factor